MITADTIKFISQDLFVFGIAVLLIFVVVLSYIFRSLVWVLIPLLTAGVTSILSMGAVGWLGWKVTVVSANFVSILMIISISLMVHLIVRYQELASINKNLNQRELVGETLRQMFLPCLYTALTTLVAFASLIVSDIKPVIDFGIIMVLGVSITFLFAFIFFGSLLPLINKDRLNLGSDNSSRKTLMIHSLAKNNPYKVILFSLLVLLLSSWGISKLTVENKFIDYFKSSTEIYKGLSLIDRKLGGTATLDVIIDAPEVQIAEDQGFDDFDCLLYTSPSPRDY